MTSNFVQTVLGPVSAEALGVTLPHEHLALDLYRDGFIFRSWKLTETDWDLVSQELLQFKGLGGNSLVDVTPPDLGRDVEYLVRMAEATGINIIMGMGRYREPFYERELWEMSTRELASEFIREATEGVRGVLPGVIGEIGVHGYTMSPVEERVHRAAARAHVESGLPITTHAAESTIGLDQLDVFEEENVDLTRVAIGHCDSHPVQDYYRAILARGAYVEFDLIRGQNERETSVQEGNILELVSDGYVQKILLSQDVCCKEHLKAYGGHGYSFILESFGPRLLAAGLSQEDLNVILIENPKHFLVGTAS